MGATYTRQSSYSDGDVIQASDTNNEFDQLLAAFAASSGHTHDGTTGEGGPITKLLGTSLTLGDGTAGTDITVTFDGESNDGVLKWMEDEDYFEFSDDILVASTEKIQFGDTASFIQQSSDGVLRIDGEATINLNASSNVDVSNDMRLRSDSSVISFGADSDVSITHVADTALLLNSSRQLQFGDSGTYIHQSTDGQLDLVADTEIQIAATTIDINGNVDISGTLTIGSAGISEAELEILDGATVTTDELNILDGVTSTATELNVMDGDTSASSTTLADADRVVVNDAGTMKQVALTDFETYFESALDTLSNVTTVGALNSGSITSGFGAIDNGSSAITTTGTITYGSLSDGTITITAFVDEDDMSSNSATLVPTQQSVKAYVDTQLTAEDLDFQADSGGALSIDLDSETLTFTGGTGIDTSGSGNAVTFAIDSTVATLSGTQTLTNKTLTTPVIAEITNGSSITLNAVTDIILDAGGANVLFKDDGTEILDIGNSSGDVSLRVSTADKNFQIKGTDGSSAITALDIDMADAGAATFNNKIIATELDISGDVDIDGTLETDALSIASTTVTSTAAELNILDGVTTTATELNIMDGDTSASSTTLVDADRLVANDNGTMKQVALTDVKTYLSSAGFSTDDPTALAIALG